ncbi:hypothetical protein C0995_012446 [Termitomyces sp. Mi166|nr:hypothetical protein C0995_012446 [Termitomyces sp. Mi166\
MPAAYATFADILALTNPETKCQYHLSELAANGGFTQVKTPFPKGFLPTAFVDPHLELLVTIRFISKQGLVNKETIEDVCDFLATRETSPPAVEPGPFTSHNCNKHQAINPQQTPLSSLASSLVSTLTPTYHSHHSAWPVTTKGLVICSPNPRDKGKVKAAPMPSTEDDSMVINPDLVNPSEGNVDADGELVDFPESPQEPAEKKDGLIAPAIYTSLWMSKLLEMLM